MTLLDFAAHYEQGGKDALAPPKILAITFFAQVLLHLRKTV